MKKFFKWTGIVLVSLLGLTLLMLLFGFSYRNANKLDIQ